MNARNQKSVSAWWKNIKDPEMKILAKLLTERLASNNEAAQKAGLIAYLKRKMQTDIVEFLYYKESGEDRPAFGTRCPQIISRYHWNPSGREQTQVIKTFNYFDLERKAWRSFRPENLVRVNDNYSSFASELYH